MVLIENLKPMEAVICGETMIVQFPTGHKQYKVDGELFSNTYNKQIPLKVGCRVQEYTPSNKILIGVICLDGDTYTVQEYHEIENDYCFGEDYPDLETEFEHRKLLSKLQDGQKLYETIPEIHIDVDITVVGEYKETGSDFIITPLVFGKARFSTEENSFYRVNIEGVVLDEIKAFALKHSYNLEGVSGHTKVEYVKLDGSYVFLGNDFNLLVKHKRTIFPTLELAKLEEKVCRDSITKHLTAKFSKGEMGGVLISEMFKELRHIQTRLNNLEVKQKSSQTLSSLKAHVKTLIERLGE